MNIFEWLEPIYDQLEASGQHRLVARLRSLGTLVCDDEHDAVDALVPELLAETKRLKHPWLEIYVRHWALQSKIFKRYDVATSLDDAVQLLDLASTEGNEDCPQSICAVQDLCAGYGIADGPGYVEERLAVIAETLARITPEWPCFTCISSERVGALLHAGRAEEALVFIKEQDAAIGDGKNNFGRDMAKAYLDLGRPEEALEHADRPPKGYGGEHEQVEWRLDRARVRAHLGRFDEAAALAPDFESEVRSTPSLYRGWLDLTRKMAEGGAWPNDGWLDARVAGMARVLDAHGARRLAFQTTEARIELAIRRGRKATALGALADLERLLGALRRPLDAPAVLARLRDQVEAMADDPPAALGETAEATLSSLPKDPEARRAVLSAAAERWPTDHELLSTLVRVAREPGEVELVERLLERAVAAAPEEDFLHTQQGHFYRVFRPEQLDAWAEPRLVAGHPGEMAAHWSLGLRAAHDRDFAEARRRFEAVVQRLPERRNPRVFLSEALLGLGELELGVAQLETASEHHTDDRDLMWRRIQIDTRLGRWSQVRALSAALGMSVEPGEDPIDEPWEDVNLLYPPEITRGPPETVAATRTGPVTARVLTMGNPGEPSRFREEVVFNACPVDEGPNGEGPVTFRVIAVTKSVSTMSFYVEGAKPPAESLDRLELRLRAEGAGIARAREDDWKLLNEETDEEREGFYWLVSLPLDSNLRAAHEAMLELAAELDGMLAWLDLAEKVDDEPEVARQRPLVKAWNLL